MANKKKSGQAPLEDKDEATKPATQSTLPQPQAAATQPAQPVFVENLQAEEIFASEAQNFSLVQGMVTVTFTSTRYDHSTTPAVQKKVVVSRLVMPAAAASSMATRLFHFLVTSKVGPAPIDPKQVQ